MQRTLARWVKQSPRKVFRRFGCDLRRYPHGNKKPALRVLINAQLPDGIAGGVQQNVARLMRALMDAASAETFLAAGPCVGDQWLRSVCAPPHILRGHLGGHAAHSAWQRVWYRLLAKVRRRPAARMAKLVRSARAQLVHFPYQTFEPVGCPFIYEPWDLQHRHLPEFFAVEEIARRDRTYRDGCEKAALVVTATHWVKQDLVAQFGLPPEKIAVIERPAFGADFRPPSSAEAAKLLRPLRLPDNYFFYPAKDFPHKNHLRLFAAIAAVR
jgi:hypothetical protein